MSVRVGASLSLSGAFAHQGRDVHTGILLWVDLQNAAGGLAGHPVELVVYDDASRPRQAAALTERLIEEDRVDLLLGPYASGPALAAAAVAESHGKILWNHGGASDDLHARGHRWIVSGLSPASAYLQGLPARLPRRVAAVHSSRGTFARQVMRGLGDFPVEGIPLEGDPVEALRRLRPEALVVVAAFDEEIALLGRRDEFPDSIRQVVAVAAGVQAFGDVLGDKAEGVVGPTQWLPGGDDPLEDWFVAQFHRLTGRDPDYPAAGAFAMGRVAAECVRRTGSLQDAALRQAAADLDLTSFYGRFRIDPDTGRQVGHQVRLVQWRSGRREPF